MGTLYFVIVIFIFRYEIIYFISAHARISWKRFLVSTTVLVLLLYEYMPKTELIEHSVSEALIQYNIQYN